MVSELGTWFENHLSCPGSLRTGRTCSPVFLVVGVPSWRMLYCNKNMLKQHKHPLMHEYSKILKRISFCIQYIYSNWFLYLLGTPPCIVPSLWFQATHRAWMRAQPRQHKPQCHHRQHRPGRSGRSPQRSSPPQPPKYIYLQPRLSRLLQNIFLINKVFLRIMIE